MTDHPILFKSDMTLAIMTCAQCGTVTLEIECPKCGSKERRKTQTRRIIKPQPVWVDGKFRWHKSNAVFRHGPNEEYLKLALPEHNPHGVPGDLLWVRENWWAVEVTDIGLQYGVFDDEFAEGVPEPKELRLLERQDWRWGRHPSIHMPKLICRNWLKVKSVRVEQVQEISIEDAFAEGVHTQQATHVQPYFKALWDSINAKPKPCYAKKQITHYESYPWDDVRKTIEHRGKPWHVYGNPHIFATEFERYDIAAAMAVKGESNGN